MYVYRWHLLLPSCKLERPAVSTRILISTPPEGHTLCSEQRTQLTEQTFVRMVNKLAPPKLVNLKFVGNVLLHALLYLLPSDAAALNSGKCNNCCVWRARARSRCSDWYCYPETADKPTTDCNNAPTIRALCVTYRKTSGHYDGVLYNAVYFRGNDITIIIIQDLYISHKYSSQNHIVKIRYVVEKCFTFPT